MTESFDAAMPRIGLTTYVEQARWGVWDERAALLATNYLEAVAAAGGLPVLLPPIVPSDLGAAAMVAVSGIDGLVLAGGSDVDPARYGAAPHSETDAPRSDRDGWEMALLRAALDAGRPVLAICRGAQLLNVARGGSLHQHLPEVVGDPTHRPELGTFARVVVQVEPASRLFTLVGEVSEVHCHHHQAIDRLGEGVTVCARQRWHDRGCGARRRRLRAGRAVAPRGGWRRPALRGPRAGSTHPVTARNAKIVFIPT